MKVTRVFLDTDMRCSFDGLRKVVASADTPITHGSTILFLNRKATMFKVLRGDTYLVSYTNGTKRIPLEAIQELPQFFGGSESEMSEAIRTSIMKKLNIRAK